MRCHANLVVYWIASHLLARALRSHIFSPLLFFFSFLIPRPYSYPGNKNSQKTSYRPTPSHIPLREVQCSAYNKMIITFWQAQTHPTSRQASPALRIHACFPEREIFAATSNKIETSAPNTPMIARLGSVCAVAARVNSQKRNFPKPQHSFFSFLPRLASHRAHTFISRHLTQAKPKLDQAGLSRIAIIATLRKKRRGRCWHVRVGLISSGGSRATLFPPLCKRHFMCSVLV